MVYHYVLPSHGFLRRRRTKICLCHNHINDIVMYQPGKVAHVKIKTVPSGVARVPFNSMSNKFNILTSDRPVSFTLWSDIWKFAYSLRCWWLATVGRSVTEFFGGKPAKHEWFCGTDTWNWYPYRMSSEWLCKVTLGRSWKDLSRVAFLALSNSVECANFFIVIA